MRVYRILEAKHAPTAFTGEGARLYSGRWNSPGIPMVYAASSLSLAILEMLVNTSTLRLPRDMVYATIDIPEDAAPLPIDLARLPAKWHQTPAPRELALAGDEWVRSLQSVALIVPSAIARIEDNVLLNPEHSHYRRLTFGAVLPVAIDPRLTP